MSDSGDLLMPGALLGYAERVSGRVPDDDVVTWRTQESTRRTGCIRGAFSQSAET